MTNEEIHNIYLHMSGKAEGLMEAGGKADFPVMFARAILQYANHRPSWVGLTDEEFESICDTARSHCQSWKMVVRAIEAKLKEKNG